MRTNLFRLLTVLSVMISTYTFSTAPDTVLLETGIKSIDLLSLLKVIHTGKEILPDSAVRELLTNGKSISKASVGFNDDVYWVLFTTKNTSEKDHFIIEIKNPQIDFLQLNKVDSGKTVTVFTTGDEFPFTQRMMWNRNFSFPVSLQSNQTQTFLFKIYKRNSSLNFPISIWARADYENRVYLENLGYGLYFGFILLCIIYSFLTFLFLRKPTYLWYCAWGVSTWLFIFTALGFSHQFLYPQADDFNGMMRIVAQKFLIISFFNFSKHFLNLKQVAPLVNRVVNWASFFMVSVLALMFALPSVYRGFAHIIMPTVYIITIVVILWVIVTCIASWKKQRLNAQYYLIAFSAVFVGAFIIIFEEFGFIPANKIIVNPYMIGSAFEMLVLSLGITFQIKKVYDERNHLSLKFAQQQKELLKAYVNGVDKERERISRELHDDIGSRLSTLNRFIIKRENQNEKLQEQIEILCDDVRDMSHRLAPATLKITGLKQKISELIATIQIDTQIQTDVQFYDFPDELDNETSTHLYRILQEAFHNITKHAQASVVDLQFFGYEDELVITIEDNGKGFKQQALPGIGLQNMRARAASLNGTLEVNSQPGLGTQIMLRIPIGKDHRESKV